MILYTSTDENIVVPYFLSGFNQVIKSNIYNQIGKITFMGPFLIGESVFRDCNNLKTIIIPNSITSIGFQAFTRCTNLISVTIPDSVTKIGQNAFSSCSNLVSVTIPDSVISIEAGAFADCTSFISVTIPDSVTKIEIYAFSDCTNLTSVTIGNSVTMIGSKAFDNCESLKAVYCKPTTPPTGGSGMFSRNASGRKIYVPYQSLNAYKTAEYWSDYADDIVGYDFENDTVVGGNEIEFPITLVMGDNGQLGIDLYNYILNKYGRGYYGEIEEDIFIPNDKGEGTKVIGIDVTFSIAFRSEASTLILRATGILE